MNIIISNILNTFIYIYIYIYIDNKKKPCENDDVIVVVVLVKDSFRIPDPEKSPARKRGKEGGGGKGPLEVIELGVPTKKTLLHTLQVNLGTEPLPVIHPEVRKHSQRSCSKTQTHKKAKTQSRKCHLTSLAEENSPHSYTYTTTTRLNFDPKGPMLVTSCITLRLADRHTYGTSR